MTTNRDADHSSENRASEAAAKNAAPENASSNFIRNIIAEDQKSGRYQGRVATRFPPEPNGYLHIGHAKSICLNFSLAREFQGICNLRFDDTNPAKEDIEYVESIQSDIRWLGFERDALYFASDYFEQLYQYAIKLIKSGHAYVCSLSEEEVRAYRGTVNEPGRESPYRNRSVEENLDLFARMRNGEFPEGAHTLRGKIDMAAPNMKLRDPPLYRIRHASHYRTGDAWHIYPMYDYAHPLSDAIEQITHSICTLEFENNRDIYDWLLEACEIPNPPHQYEFARLVLNYTVLSKRKLIELVRSGIVAGWDDPRMPTVAGLRRRGVTPEAIRDFCERIGLARANSVVDVALLERCIRDDLHEHAPRVMCVLNPLKVVIENWPAGRVEELDCPYFPGDLPREGSRMVPFTRELYIERDDFMENPPKGFFRLAPGSEVRLRYGYFIKCTGVVRDPASGEVLELHCTYDPATRGGNAPDGRKVRGTIHWVSADRSLEAEVRLYDRLFSVEDPGAAEDFKACLNPNSLVTLKHARIEPAVLGDAPGSRYQFERQGFFCLDPVEGVAGRLVYNRTVTLKDSRTKAAGEGEEVGKAEAKPEKVRTEKAEKSEKPDRNETPTRSSQALAQIAHFRATHGLSEEDAGVLVDYPALLSYFEQAIAVHNNPRGVANWIINELQRELKERRLEDLPFGPVQLAELVALIDDGTISGSIAKGVFADLVQDGGSPRAIVDRKGLRQVADAGALEPIVDRVLAANPDSVARYREGRANLLGFFVGQVLKETGGRANPKLVTDLLKAKL